MRPTLAAALGLALLATACTHAPAQSVSESGARLGPACGKGDASIPGHYFLNGVMEVGSELLLRPDGSFEFYLAYGANDQYGKGCWTQNGKIVALFPAGQSRISGSHTPDSRGFGGIVLRKEGSDLVWDIGGSGHKGRYEKAR